MPTLSSASSPAVCKQCSFLSTNSLEVRRLCARFAPPALGLQRMKPSLEPKSALFSVPFQPLTALPNGPFPCSLPHPSQVPPKPLAVLLNPSLNPFLQRFTPGPPTGRPRPLSAPPPKVLCFALILFPLATPARGCKPRGGPHAGILGPGLSWRNPGMAWERSRSKTRTPCGDCQDPNTF